jgi:hypothetical protein
MGKTWSLILREEHRLRMFENRVLMRIFGPKRDEVTGDWRKLHNACDAFDVKVLTAVVMKNSVFWYMTSCSPMKLNRRFGE